MSFLSALLLAIVYGFTGFILAFPYLYLSGWSNHVALITVALSPMIFTIWLLLGVLSKVLLVGRLKRLYEGVRVFPPIIFWAWTIWWTLPILMHGASKVAAYNSNPIVSGILFENRFLSLSVPLIIIVAVIIVLLAVEMNQELRQYIINKNRTS